MCLGRRLQGLSALIAPGTGFDPSCVFAHLIQWTAEDALTVDEDAIAVQANIAPSGAVSNRVSAKARASLIRDLATVKLRLLARIRRIYTERRAYRQARPGPLRVFVYCGRLRPRHTHTDPPPV